MPKFYITCKYCDWKFFEWLSSENINTLQCPHCKDRDLIIREHKDYREDIFGYNNNPIKDAYIKRRNEN